MQDPEQNQSQVYDEEDSAESARDNVLKSQITHSDNSLQKLLVDHDLYFSKIKQYNDIAVTLIEQKNNREALIYLQEAERMLEYGAMRGKTIDRNLILCVLNSEAVAYQKQWIIDKAAKYIEALIYNIQISIEEDAMPFQTLYSFDLEKSQIQLRCLSLIKRKNMLIKYYLIYCALMSQLKQNNIALEHSFKALALLKQIFGGYSRYYKSNAFREKEQRIYTAKKLRLLKQLSIYNEHLQVESYQTLFKRTQCMLRQWKETISQVKPDQKLQIQIKDFSIAHVMQPTPMTYKDFDRKIDIGEELQMLSLVKKVLLFTINFFSIATEIRLIDAHNHLTQEEKMKSVEFKRSELYHLTAIKVFCTYIPYDSVLVKHIQTSYNNHYKNQLNNAYIEHAPDDQNLVSYTMGQQYEEDVIKPVQKPLKKKKYVPMIEIPKSPKPNTSKTKLSNTKKKTPRMIMTSPPPTTTRKRKEIGTIVSPKATKRNISNSKAIPNNPKLKTKESQKIRETSRNKAKSRISKDKSELRKGKEKQKQKQKEKSQTKMRNKSKSQTKLRNSKYSQHQFAPKYRSP